MIFFRCTPPKQENAGEKRCMDNGTWVTRSHQKPSKVRDDGVGTWLGGNSSVLTWLCKEVNLKDSAFQINYWRLIMECWTCLFSIIRRETCLFHPFSRSVMSNSLRPHESQHARPPCPSPAPGVHPDSRPSSQWYHPAISSFVVPFSSCPQSPQHQSLFQWVNSLREVAKVLEFQL